jgi:hypothetical protein
VRLAAVCFWVPNTLVAGTAAVWTRSDMSRVLNTCACVVSALFLVRAVRILRSRLANRPYVALTRDLKAAIRSMPSGPVVNSDAGVFLIYECQRLAWWYPVRCDSVIRLQGDDVADIRDWRPSAVVMEVFTARRDGTPIMRRVDGMQLQADEDGTLTELNTVPAKFAIGSTMRSLSSGLHDLSAEELAELREQIAGARTVGADDSGA